MINVVAGILIKENKVLIARRASHKSLPGKWEFPGGKIKDGESHHTALERELFEEFGIRTNTQQHFLTTEYTCEDFSIRLIAYIIDHLNGEFRLIDHDLIDWVEFEDLNKYDLAEADIPIAQELKRKGKLQ